MPRIIPKLSPRVVYWLVVVSIVFAVHTSYLINGFVWLDHGDIEAGRSILTDKPLLHAFVTPLGETHFYRPIVTLLNTLDFRLYGLWAPGYHLTNTILHIVATASVVVFVRIYFKLSSKTALLAGLIFGVHPLSWLPTGAISYRSELLLVIGICTTLSFHVLSETRRKIRYIFFTIVCFALALLSKETALIIIPLAIIADKVGNRKIRNQNSLTKLLFLYFFEVVLLASYIGTRIFVLPSLWNTSYHHMPINEVVGTRIYLLIRMIISLFSPLIPSLSDATAVVPLTLYVSMLYLLGALSIGYGVYILVKKMPKEKTRIVVFIALSLLPGLSFIPLPRMYSPHYAYLAAVGSSSLIAYIYDTLRHQKTTFLTQIGKGSIIVWIVVAIWNTYSAGSRFASDYTLFYPEIQKTNTYREGSYYLGMYFLTSGDIDQAKHYFTLSLRETPHVIAFVDSSALYINYSQVLFIEGKYDEADEFLLNALLTASASERYIIMYNRALIQYQKQNYSQTIDILESYNGFDEHKEMVSLWTAASKKAPRD